MRTDESARTDAGTAELSSEPLPIVSRIIIGETAEITLEMLFECHDRNTHMPIYSRWGAGDRQARGRRRVAAFARDCVQRQCLRVGVDECRGSSVRWRVSWKAM